MLKYVGRGNYLPGVPARDLTDEEAEACGGRVWLLETGLYVEPAEAGEKETIEEKGKVTHGRS